MFKDWRTTPAELDAVFEWLLERPDDAETRSSEFVRGIVDAAVSPKTNIAEMDEALRQVNRDWAAADRPLALMITRHELCYYGTKALFIINLVV
jgi:hypothetical protein